MIQNENWRELEFRCNGGAGCVITERVGGCIVIRDSKNPTQAGLVFSKREYADFRRRVRGDTRSRAVLRFATSLLRMAAVALRQIVG